MVETGLQRVCGDPKRWLRGRRFGLVANVAARDAAGRPAHQALSSSAPGGLGALFAPEHGLEAVIADGAVVPSVRLPDGLVVHSLYQEHERGPVAAALDGLDLLVVDLQDIGARYYTYVSTLVECLLAAARGGLPVMVLDRPNPLGGAVTAGPRLEPAYRSFIGALDVPVRHGLTMAEIARLVVRRAGLDPALLEIVPMRGWRRSMDWSATRLTWWPPSPAARSLAMVRLYPAACLIEGTNLSEGRGTDAPFELIGAPWLDGPRLALELAELGGADSRTDDPERSGQVWPSAAPAEFTPAWGKHAGVLCQGVRLDAGGSVAAVEYAVALIGAARGQRPEAFAWTMAEEAASIGHWHADLLAGGPWLREAVEAGTVARATAALWDEPIQAYLDETAPLLLYPPAPGEWQPRVAAGAWSTGQPLALDTAAPGQVAAAVVASAAGAVQAAGEAVAAIGRAIEAVGDRVSQGGRLIYAGAGTSGRLGVLDASECEPTFGAGPEQVAALMAGGPEALLHSVEGAEDDTAAAVRDLAALAVGPADAVVGVAASGSTPYTMAALAEARRLGALTVAVCGRAGSPLAAGADLVIEADAGPEPLLGSTRLGAGTAQKVICNALSTGVFARLGWVYGDLMVGVQPRNAKLRARAAQMVGQVTGAAPAEVEDALAAAVATDARLAVRIAIVSLLAHTGPAEAAGLLRQCGGGLRRALVLAGWASCQPAGDRR